MNLTVTSGTANIELLVVGGGGASAFDNSGGGGAGGIAYASALPVTAGAHAITIGPGGTGSSTFNYPGHPNGNPTRGTNSTFTHPAGTITGLGGGGPANENPNYEIATPIPSNVYPGGSSAGGKYTYASGRSPNIISSVAAAQPSQPNFGVGVVHGTVILVATANPANWLLLEAVVVPVVLVLTKPQVCKWCWWTWTTHLLVSLHLCL